MRYDDDYRRRYAEQKSAKLAAKKLKWEQRRLARRYNWRGTMATRRKRIPWWLSPLQKDHIQLFYTAAAFMSKITGVTFQVDHIVPMQGELVSGLHVPWNLQVLTRSDNIRKRNK